MSPRTFGVRFLVSILLCALWDRPMLSAQDVSTRGYLDRVKLIRKKSNAEAVKKLMADIDAEWGAKKDAAYYYVILELCGAVSSWPALDIGAFLGLSAVGVLVFMWRRGKIAAAKPTKA